MVAGYFPHQVHGLLASPLRPLILAGLTGVTFNQPQKEKHVDNSNDIYIQLINLRDTLRKASTYPADSGTGEVIRYIGLEVARLLQDKLVSNVRSQNSNFGDPVTQGVNLVKLRDDRHYALEVIQKNYPST